MGLWEQVAFLDRTKFWNKCKALIQFKTFSQHTAKTNSHRNKDNEHLPFLNATCPCKLAVQHPIFEKYRSCVCTATTLSHRFKTSEKVGRITYRFRDERRKYHEKIILQSFEPFSGSREGRGPSATFGSFRRSEKNKTVSFFGNFRGFANLDSAHATTVSYNPN